MSYSDERVAIDREVRFGDFTYPFRVRAGERSWDELTRTLNGLEADRFVVVTDDGVPTKLADEVRTRFSNVAPTEVLQLPANEKAKTLETLDKMAEQTIRTGVTRNSVVVALGGGLAGNVAGLMAALIFRGLRLLHLPTTLLAMSDSVLSLKQAVNSRAGKNHLGCYHAPVLVWNHLDFLDTLPETEIKSALCEMIKNVVGIVPERYDEIAGQLRTDGRYTAETIGSFIELCVDAKVSVMINDAREKREALVLEYGHTVGHAAELLTGGALKHGFAIGVGGLVAGRIAVELGYMDSTDEKAHRILLERNGAPTELPDGLDVEAVMGALRLDNKRGYIPRREGAIDMILLEGLGRPRWGIHDNMITQVDEDVVRTGINAYLPGVAA